METHAQKNLEHIKQRLSWLEETAEGVLYCYPASFNFVMVSKVGTSIQLSYADKSLKTPYVQSSLDLVDPLQITSLSIQVMLLSLLWQRHPQTAYVAGFGAGRLPWMLNHWLPDIQVECTDIEPKTAAIASLFFGVEFTAQLRLTLQDARTYLVAQASTKRYDLIIVDVALGNGYTPYSLVTQEFFRLCQQHLSAEGVLVLNCLPDDRFVIYKLQTLQSVFKTTYACTTQANQLVANTILFATAQANVSNDELLQRSQVLQQTLHPSFSFPNHLVRLCQGNELLQRYFEPIPTSAYLWDSAPPPHYFDALPPLHPLRMPVADDVICPCGSGRTFITCHGL